MLGRPPAQGFNLTVYVLPPAILLLGLAILAITLPRWRRRSRAAAAARAGGALPALDARRRARASRTSSAATRAEAYIDSGALTPSRPSDSAIVRCAATDSAIRNDSTASGVAPTTLQAS